MKVGAIVPVLNEWRFMRAVTGQLLEVVDRCVILRGNRALSGAPVKLTPIPKLDPRVEIVEGNWRNENHTRNAGMTLLADCDYVFMVDSDELLLTDDLRLLRQMCEAGKHRVIGVRLLTYWKTVEYRIDPPEPGIVKMVLRRDVRFEGLRGVEEPAEVADVWCRHLSYVRSDAELLEKLRLFSHANEIRSNWYERVWKAWDSNRAMVDLHPTQPPAYKRAILERDHPLEAVLKRWDCH